MTAFTYRDTKGQALTHGELDGNFRELELRTGARWANAIGMVNTQGLAFPPTPTLYKGVYLPSFDFENVNETSITVRVPNNYIPGTLIYAYINILCPFAGTGSTRWGYAITWANMHTGAMQVAGVPFNATHSFIDPILFELDYPLLPEYQHIHRVREAPFPLPMTGALPGALLHVHLYRAATHANDTYEYPLFLMSAGINYQAQSFGMELRNGI